MGWTVSCHGNITFPDAIRPTMFNEIYDLLKSQKAFYDIKAHPDFITFGMSGNKGIDYTPLEEIQKQILEIFEKQNCPKDGLIISASEYQYTDEGYYFEVETEIGNIMQSLKEGTN